jgi:PAS domain S-box-containing protein
MSKTTKELPLRYVERELQLISLDPLVMFDREGIILDVSEATIQATGRTREELIGTPFADYFTDPERAYKGALLTFEIGEVRDYELVMKARDGTETIVAYNASVYRDQTGQVVGAYADARDITERKRTEEAVLESEEKFRAISSSAKDAIIMMDDEGNISYWNEAAEKIFGYSVQEALGKELHIFLAPKKYHDAYRRGILVFKETGCGPVIGKTLELEAVRKDGTMFPIELSVSAVKIEGKWHAIGIVRDITERKKAEEERETLIRELQDALAERRRSEKKIHDLQHYSHGLIEASLDPLVTFDQKGVILDVNEATVKATGRTREELIGTPFANHFTDPKKAYKGVMLVFETGEVRDYELFVKARDGTETIVSCNASVFKDQTGQVVGAFAAARDITECKLVEHALHSQIELEKLIAAISTNFIISPSEIDNEINNALKAIGEFSGVDRSYVFQFYNSGKKMDNTHEWCKEDIESQINILQGISIEEDYPNFTERIRRLEVIHVPNVADLPPEAGLEKEKFQMLSIKSLILVPIVYGHILIGFLGLDSVKTEKTWKEDDIRLLKMVGETFANALERKRAEQEIQNLQNYNRGLIEASPDPLVTFDKKGILMDVNEAKIRATGRTREELIGTPFADYFTDSEEAYKEVMLVFETGEVRDYELVMKARDGTETIVAYNASVYEDQTGQVVGAVGVARDITERKKTQQELQETIDRLEAYTTRINSIVVTMLGEITDKE